MRSEANALRHNYEWYRNNSGVMLGILCQHTGLPWRDLQADWNSRVRSRHVILPPVNGHPPAVDNKQPAAVCTSALCGG